MPEIPKDLGFGGANLTPEAGSPGKGLNDILRGTTADRDAVIDAFNALLAKLDADAGVTDVDYVATLEIDKATLENSNE